ncbi:MAG: hypothetical protein Q8N16_03075 [bacterium]|nr:hypothetical protein [bacterium]
MSGDFYHILNRGVEERDIFYSEKDYFRFAYNLHDFNDTKLALPYPLRRSRAKHIGHAMSNMFNYAREEIIGLLCWCLMPNHAHVFVREKIDGGASVFSKKIFGGYTKYINEIKKRKGVLFQGRSKIILIEKDEHFLHLPFYIMANPVSLIEPKWREKGIVSLKKVIDFLENYRWSSFQDLIGKDNFPETVNKNLFYELFDTNEGKFKKDFIEWLGGYR